MSFTLCTSGAIIIKAGINANAAAKSSGAVITQFADEAEGFINTATRYDWVANYTRVGANFKPILADIASDLAGASLIAYDMSNYTSRGEAESMVNILHDKAMRGIKILEDEKVKEEMGVST